MQIKHQYSLISLAALLAPISAGQTSFNATYDDIDPAVISPLDPIGVYKGISYASVFDLSSPGIDGEALSGVVPHSNPSYVRASGNGDLTIAYAGPKSETFALNSWYFGCTANTDEGKVDLAAPCNVTVAGYQNGASKPAASQTFEFTPEEIVDVMNPPQFAKFSSKFQGLQTASISFVPADLVVLRFDNLVGSLQS